jgi:hypothetical protein
LTRIEGLDYEINASLFEFLLASPSLPPEEVKEVFSATGDTLVLICKSKADT